MTHPTLEGVGRFSYRFASLIMAWNHAEDTAKQIAQQLLGESSMTMALTAEVGNRTLMHAIEVASHEMDEIGSHLRHFSSGFTRLLGYRNFYVHALKTIQHNGLVPGQFEGLLFSYDGKGRARFFNRGLTQVELQVATEAMHTLTGYGAAIQKELGVNTPELLHLLETYEGSLEKPNWPQPVEKTPLYLQGQEPPPQEPSRKRGNRKKKPPAV